MLSYLAFRESGIHNPSALLRAETTRRLFLLELSKHQDVEQNHSAGINCLDIDPVENRYLLSGGADGVIAVHDLHKSQDTPSGTYQHVCKIGKGNKCIHKFSVETTQWYPLDTGMFLSSGMDHQLKVWDANTLQTADEYQFSGAVYRHDMSPVATKHCLVAVACASSAVQLIDLKCGSATHTLQGHRKPVKCVKWSPKDEFLLATGGDDSRALLWDVRSARGCLMTLDQHNGDSSAGPNSVNTAHNGHVNGLAFTHDGLHMLTFGTDDHIRLWNTASGKNTNVNFGRIRNDSKKSVQMCVSNNASPNVVLVPNDNHIEMLELAQGIKVTTLRGHYNQVNSCVIHPMTQDLFSGANDRNILVWVPQTTTVSSYEEHLKNASREKDKTDKKISFTSRVGAGDDWSSDED